MTYLDELREWGRHFSHWAILILFFSLFFFSFGLKQFAIFGQVILVPVPASQSFSVLFFEIVKNDLVPEGVSFIVTNPASAFTSQALISVLLALVFSVPYILYTLIRYLSPALFVREQKAIIGVIVPSVLLFVSGMLFAYFFIIPPTFSFLYDFAPRIGAIPLFSVNEFISLVFSLVVITGFSFLLPVCMFLMSRLGLIPGIVWRKNWRIACVAFLIFAALITPDGSGITMAFLSLPLCALYGLGVFLSGRLSN